MATPWAPLPPADEEAEEEVRLALVLNGGVSLAVWMGGVVTEVDRLTRRRSTYDRILRVLRSLARADVMAGTSAGGINGACLAVAQVHANADLQALRDVWATRGSMEDLLRTPWQGDPPSLMQGDAYFLPALRQAFADMLPRPGLPEEVTAGGLYDPADRPVQLVLTTTLLTPTAVTVTDAVGTEVAQPQQAARFTFSRPVRRLDDEAVSRADDAFAPKEVADLAGPLALAARSTASFPVAFEPSYVPIGTSTDALHPDMARYASFGASRWTVDGGVLLNTPLRPVLEAISAAPAARQVRRVLLLVVPDPYVAPAAATAPDDAAALPPLRETLQKVVLAPAAQTVANELGDIERHNQKAQARRAARSNLLDSLTSPGRDLGAVAAAILPEYREIRVRRAAMAIATVAAPHRHRPLDELTEEYTAVLRGQPLDFVPDLVAGGLMPAAADEQGRWLWGLATLERIAASVLDLLRRAVWVVPTDVERTALREMRAELHEFRGVLGGLRAADVLRWREWIEARVPTPLAAALQGWDLTYVPPATSAGSLPTANAWRLPADGRRLAVEMLRIGRFAADLLEQPPDADPVLGWDRLEALVRLFRGASDEELLERALAFEVCYVCLVDNVAWNDESEFPVELVQVSADVRQHFPRSPQLAAKERVAGLRLAHFAAFLKQSWRINDWTWGRLDAANRLVTTLLDPIRMRRLVVLGGDTPAVATAMLEDLLGDRTLNHAERAAAMAVLTGQVTGPEAGRLALQPLVDALVTELAEEIVAQETPALERAVRVDRADGANRDSRGERWLDRLEPLLPSLTMPAGEGPGRHEGPGLASYGVPPGAT